MRRRAPINSRPAGCVPDSQPSARRYRPSSKLGRLVRARDGHCKFPGCGVATARCDLDHGQPFDHDNPTAGGPTTAHNLQCLCRWHHCLKTRGDWTVTALPGAVMSWTSPTGTTHETQPHGWIDHSPDPWDEFDLPKLVAKDPRTPDETRQLYDESRFDPAPHQTPTNRESSRSCSAAAHHSDAQRCQLSSSMRGLHATYPPISRTTTAPPSIANGHAQLPVTWRRRPNSSGPRLATV